MVRSFCVSIQLCGVFPYKMARHRVHVMNRKDMFETISYMYMDCHYFVFKILKFNGAWGYSSYNRNVLTFCLSVIFWRKERSKMSNHNCRAFPLSNFVKKRACDEVVFGNYDITRPWGRG